MARDVYKRQTIDGRDLESVLTFEPSPLRDSIYYPTVQWSCLLYTSRCV